MQGALIIFIIFVLFPGIILGFILLARYLKYRETLAMIQHGITPPLSPPPPVMMAPMMAPPPMPRPPVIVRQGSGAGRGTLIWGLVLAGIGLALTLALWPIGFIANSASGNTVNFPLGLGPWMLAGFAPLFVGLALILGYVITRPERNPIPPAPGWEGGAVGAYPAHWVPTIPTGNGVPIAPTEPITHAEESDPAPPGRPTP